MSQDKGYTLEEIAAFMVESQHWDGTTNECLEKLTSATEGTCGTYLRSRGDNKVCIVFCGRRCDFILQKNGDFADKCKAEILKLDDGRAIRFLWAVMADPEAATQEMMNLGDCYQENSLDNNGGNRRNTRLKERVRRVFGPQMAAH